MNTKQAQQLIERFSRQRILVVGDLLLDRYVVGGVHRISPEAPVPVVNVRQEHHVPGGACNVAMNIAALGGTALLAGVTGDDDSGRELCEALQRLDVDTSLVLRDAKTSTIVKTRIMAEQQQICRVDWEDPFLERIADNAAWRAEVLAAIDQATGLVIEDYGKGVVHPNLVRPLLDRSQTLNIPSGFDPKDNHTINCAGVTVATPNRKEALHAAGIREQLTDGEQRPLGDDAVLKAGAWLMNHWQPEKLLLTLGAQGMLLFERDQVPEHVPTRAREVYDVSGAGDTVIAVCLLALAAGAGFREAAELANAAAGLVVAKLGTATCSAEELLTALS